MVFSSLTFICIFLPVVFLLYYIVPSIHLKNALLIIASLLFYAYGEPVYVVLMVISTVLNYIFGLLLKGDGEKTVGRKFILFLAVIVNLGLLGVFKYADMAVSTVNQLAHMGLKLPGLDLPIGISFYTFQAMSYVIDVYRGQTKAQKNYFKVLLYISFFPQLIAGPIVKYHDIEEQISGRKPTTEQVGFGMRRFILGLSKKVLISNVVAVAADAIFSLELSQVNGVTAWIGAISYLMQIYYDFSGYSDMAIGLGAMFGFTFQENFDHPYASTTIQEFWRRWHISLSTWFKEYVYIPLGGNRKGKVRTYLNKIIVFFLTGLWHGANWTFVCWGLYHGLFLLIEGIIPLKKLPKFLGRIYALLVVCVGFVMFRADSISYGIGMITRMFTGWNLSAVSIAPGLEQCTPLFIAVVLIGFAGAFPWLPALRRKADKWWGKDSKAVVAFTYGVSMVLLMLSVLSLSAGTYNPFIYFRF